MKYADAAWAWHACNVAKRDSLISALQCHCLYALASFTDLRQRCVHKPSVRYPCNVRDVLPRALITSCFLVKSTLLRVRVIPYGTMHIRGGQMLDAHVHISPEFALNPVPLRAGSYRRHVQY